MNCEQFYKLTHDDMEIFLKSIKNESIAHHYISRFYINGFSRYGDNMVYVYSKDIGGCKRLSAKSIMKINNYYTHEDDHTGNNLIRTDPYTVEKFLAVVEGFAAKVIKKLENKKLITDAERMCLSTFISSLLFRTPLGRQNIDDFYSQVLKVSADLLEAQGELPPRPEVLKDEEFSFRITKNKLLEEIIRGTAMDSDAVFSADWIVGHTNKDKFSFISSDVPVIFLDTGIIEETTKIVPLSQKFCLYIRAPGQKRLFFKTLSKLVVRAVNKLMGKTFNDYLIARDEELLRSIVKVSKVN